VGADGDVLYRHVDDFDIDDPRVRMNLDAFLEAREVESPDTWARLTPMHWELFARGAALYLEGAKESAVSLWRRALEIDLDNFVIGPQIWVAEHPNRDRQAVQLLKEGYDKSVP